jgi:uncharacterized protein (DUF1499 family)
MRYGGLVRNIIGLLAVVSMALGPLIAHFSMGPPLAGFVPFALGGLVSIITGLVSVVQVIRGKPLTLGGGLGVLAGLGFFAIALQGAGYPRINDFTTDPADPPTYRFASALPQNAGRDMSYPKEWAAVQHECCADLHPAVVKAAPDAAFERALGVAKTMPSWTVTQTDPAGGVFEAVATSGLFRFQDDVVVRVRPGDDGTSRVDVRSKSRDGKGDLGVNAARIRAYVVAIEAAH